MVSSGESNERRENAGGWPPLRTHRRDTLCKSRAWPKTPEDRAALVGRTDLPVPPVLVVEVLSPSTALIDWNTKKALYERLGVASCWIIDPREPALTVFELDPDGGYQQIAKVVGDEVFAAERPFAVNVIPNELLGWLAQE